MSRSERYRIEIEAQDNASQTIEQVADATDRLTDEPKTVTLDADDQASDVVEDVTEAAETLDGTSADVELTATDDATEPVEAVTAATETLDGTTATVDLEATDNATGEIGEATVAAGTFDGTYTATLDADDLTATGIETATDAVDLFDAETASATLDADDAAVATTVDAATTEIGTFDDETAAATLDTTNLASGDIDAVEAELVVLDADSAHPAIDISGDDAADVTAVEDALGDLEGESASASLDVDGAADNQAAIATILDDLNTISTGVLTAAAGVALGSVFDSAADRAIDVQSLATATGESLTNATAFNEAMELAGVPISRAITMVGRVNDALAEQPELAARLGIEITGNQTPLDLFVQTVDALNSGQLTANERLSLATDLFGRRGLAIISELDTVVGDVSDEMAAMPEWQAVTEEDVRAAVEYRKTMDEVSDILGEVAQNMLSAFGPGIRDFFEFLEDAGAGLAEAFSLGQEGTARYVFDFMQDLDTEEFVRINDAFLEMGGSIESLRNNYFHLNEVTALLDLGIPPEVIAQADMTNEAYEALGTAMSDTEATAAAFRAALKDNAVDTEEWARITADGVVTMQEVEDAVNDTETSLEEEAAAVDESAAAHEAAVAAVDNHVSALETERDALQESIDKLNEKNEALQEGGDSYIDLRETQIKAEEALEDYHEALLDVEDDTRTAAQVNRDQEKALLDVVSAYDDAADAAVNEAKRTREATGASFSNADALRVKNDALLASARTMDGPEREAVLRHIARINGIPDYKITEILTDADPDDIAQVEREINKVARNREADIAAHATRLETVEAQLAWIARNRDAYIYVTQIVRTVGNLFQHGSSFTPEGVALVGETGPELVYLPQGAQVATHERTMENIRRGGGGGSNGNTYVSNTIHLPAGTRPRDVIRAERLWARRNGTPM